MRHGRATSIRGPLLVALLACTSASTARAGECQDADGDGHGFGCTAGADCNDQDASVFAGGSPATPSRAMSRIAPHATPRMSLRT